MERSMAKAVLIRAKEAEYEAKTRMQFELIRPDPRTCPRIRRSGRTCSFTLDQAAEVAQVLAPLAGLARRHAHPHEPGDVARQRRLDRLPQQ